MTVHRPADWTRVALAWPRATAAAIGGLTILALFGVARLETEVGYRAFLGAEHPIVREFDAFVERFGGGLPMLAMWSCTTSRGCNDALDDSSLQMTADVVDKLAGYPSILRVDSPATSPLMVRRVIGLPVMRTLLRDGVVAEDADDLRREALSDPSWLGRLVAPDGTAAAIVLHLRDSSGATAENAYAALRDAVRTHEAAGFEFSFAGGPVEFVVAGADLRRSTQRIMPLMVGLIAVALVLLFGAPAPAIAAMFCVGLAVLWTMGAMGWIGWAQNSLTQILPPLVLVVGVCDAVHLLGRFAFHRLVSDAESALIQAASQVGPACAMTTVTTVAGFMSLSVSGLESIARFGVLAGVAVVAALVLTFTALPLIACRMPVSWFAGRRASARWESVLGVLASWATGRAKAWIIAAAITAAAIGVIGTRHLQVEATFEALYGEDSEVVLWAGAVAQHLRAPDTLEIAIEAPAEADTVPAGAFAVVDRIQRGVAGRAGFGRSLSIVDVLRRLNGLLHGDELPLAEQEDDKGRPSSVYRLLRSRDPSVTEDLVDSRRPALRISVESTKLPQAELRSALDWVERDLIQAELPPGWTAVVTGPLAVVSRMIDAIRTTQLQSFALAAVAVFALVGIYFRSLQMAALAMVPTALPVVVTLGIMGWRGIALDIGSAMVASVILGLAVDDAIHMLARYAQEREQGLDAAAASREAVLHTGRAVVTTSIALAVGFSTLSLSSWNSIASFGVIAAIAVLVAFAAAVIVLPALMAITRRGWRMAE